MTKADITIRTAVSKDAAALTSLIYRSKQSNGYDDAFMALCVEALHITPEIIARRQTFVAEAGGALLGCAMLEPRDIVRAEVCAFFIAPEHKRRGIGIRLWNTLLSAARAKGFTQLVLDADPDAAPFYTSLGFETLHDTPSSAIPDRVIPHMARNI